MGASDQTLKELRNKDNKDQIELPKTKSGSSDDAKIIAYLNEVIKGIEDGSIQSAAVVAIKESNYANWSYWRKRSAVPLMGAINWLLHAVTNSSSFSDSNFN